MGVNEHTKKTFSELQRKKMYRYVIFKVDEKKREVVVDKIGNPAESYEDFTAALPDNDCRYAVYDFDFVTSDNCQKSKIFFIAWLAFAYHELNLIFLIAMLMSTWYILFIELPPQHNILAHTKENITYPKVISFWYYDHLITCDYLNSNYHF